MCGIYGLIYKDPGKRVDPKRLKQMGHVLNHRGPDNLGIWSKGNVGLGHRRLSIIDLRPLGNQPMSNENGMVWITFNGEIYNFPELRTYLTKKGHRFRSDTDTEVIVHLWEEEGVRCVERLRGMFAFALWDDKHKTLFLARDRMGQKPLFYTVLNDRLLFASEIKAILQDPEFKREPDIEAIHHYLSYQSVPAPFSAFKGIKKLPPAHYLLIKGFYEKPVRYWKLSYQDKLEIKSEKSFESIQEEIIERLREAVRIRLMSDVPLGAFLSGGIDSSIVTALMADLMNQPVKTFSIGFEHDEYDELPFARMVADRYQTNHYEFTVKPDARNIFPELVWYYNEPFADSSAIPTFYVSKLAKEHVTVILNGDGGDENFAGYPRYTNEGEFALKKDFPSVFGRWIRRKSNWPAFISSANGFWKNYDRLKSLTQQRLLYYYRITHFHELYKMQLYSREMRTHTADSFSVDIMLDKYRLAGTKDYLDATLSLDCGLYLPDTLMTKVDIASMAHSLEARSPFLDHQFMEFVARIPSNLKLKDGWEGKYILKKSVEPYLPNEVIYRKKMGFGVPIDHWFRSELKEMVYDILLSRKAIERGYFRKDYIENMLNRHQQGECWQYLIWNLLMLELWHLMFIDGSLSPPLCEESRADASKNFDGNPPVPTSSERS
jgi:asparagine synthase (glutamine-hydrolysing)